MNRARAARGVIALAFLLVLFSSSREALAQQTIPEPVVLPPQLSLAQSIAILRTKGLDLLIAEAQVHSAEGDVGIASAVPNPVIGLSYGRVFTYDPSNINGGCSGAFCDNNAYGANVSEQAAIEDSLSGKRNLRLKVANAALKAAKLSRDDALRNLEFQAKSAYLQFAQAQRALTFSKQVQATNVRTLELFQARLRSGAINEGELARVQTQKLEADQGVDEAAEAVNQARFALAFLLGARGPVPEFTVDDTVLDYSIPASLADASPNKLLRDALMHRPDLLSLGYQRVSAEAAIALAKRLRFPDITLGASYAQTGIGGAGTNAPLQPPTLTFSVSAPIPLFYQQQGEIRKAEANYETQALSHAKTTAQVVSDVSSAVSAYQTSRALVERMEKGGLLSSAKTARDITRTQYERGAGTLMDLLDAQRTYIATNVEYFQDLTSYWTAVAQLEQAVGMELR
jgi:cobalt-zinc-cadmium efflux system outer membrane protein